MNNQLKIDLDIKTKSKAIEHLRERLNFLFKIGIFKRKDIDSIKLLKKSKYSAIIEFKREFRDNKEIIILQSILGDDYKRTTITFKDLKTGISNFNRLFIIKKYPNGKYKKAKIINITKEVLEK